jgi:hypothetical protein
VLTQAWIGIGGVACAAGIIGLASSRGFKISKLSLFGTLEVELPQPIIVQPKRLLAYPAMLLLAIGVTALGIGFYQTWFPPVPTASATPTVEVPITPTPNLGGSGVTRSPFSLEQMGLTFLNKTTGAVELFWIDANGVAEPYGLISAGGSRTVVTFVGHLWSVKSSTGVELLRYIARPY